MSLFSFHPPPPHQSILSFYHESVITCWLLHNFELYAKYFYFVIKTNTVALSPQVNYTDWSTATCQQNLVPTFVDRGVLRGQHGGSRTIVNISFLDRSCYFSFKWRLIYAHEGWVDPAPGPLQLRKFGSAGNRTQDHWVSTQELWPLYYREGLYFVIREHMHIVLFSSSDLFLHITARKHIFSRHTSTSNTQ
jgi:hypothetical protein